MKVLGVSSLLNPTPPFGYGGTERFVHILSDQLSAQGVEMHVLGSEESTGGNYFLHTSDNTDLPTRLNTIIDQVQPDVVHMHIKDKRAIELLEKKDIPTLFTIHNNIRPSSGWVDLIANSPSNFNFSVISENLRLRTLQALISRGLNAQKPISDLGFGMDVLGYRNYAREVPKEYFMYLGVMCCYKGVLTIAQEFTKTNEDLKLVGPCNNEAETAYFDQVLHTASRANNVIYHGPTSSEQEKANLLNSAHAIVVATGYEPPEQDCHEAFGLVMLEANSLGVPVIGFRKGNVGDYIQDGVNGYLFDDASSIRTLSKLTKDNAAQLRRGSLETAKSYDIRNIATRYKDALLKIALSRVVPVEN